MKRFFLLLALLPVLTGFSQKIDHELLKDLNGTKWDLVEEKKPGIFGKKNTQPRKETITFSDGSILFDLADANYACTYKLSGTTFLLSCAESGMYSYVVRELHGTVLVMDMYARLKNGKLVRKKRLTYRRQ